MCDLLGDANTVYFVAGAKLPTQDLAMQQPMMIG